MTIYSNPNDGSEYSLTDHKSGEMICTLKVPKRGSVPWPSKYTNLGKRLEEFVPNLQCQALAESTFREEEAVEIARNYEKLADIWRDLPDAPSDDPSLDKVYLHFFNLSGAGHWYMMNKPNKTTGDHAWGYCKIFEDCGEYGSFVFNDPRYPQDDIMQVCPMLNVDIGFEPILYSDFKAQLIMDKIPADDELG